MYCSIAGEKIYMSHNPIREDLILDLEKYNSQVFLCEICDQILVKVPSRRQQRRSNNS